jgi:hypothetical protein
MSSVALGVVILVLLAALAWLLARPAASGPEDALGADDEIDRDTLEQAENEVRDLDAFTTPEEAEDELPDWGPGAPRP